MSMVAIFFAAARTEDRSYFFGSWVMEMDVFVFVQRRSTLLVSTGVKATMPGTLNKASDSNFMLMLLVVVVSRSPVVVGVWTGALDFLEYIFVWETVLEIIR